MKSTHDDLVELFDHVFSRLPDRLAGLTDKEWAWCPTPDDRVSIRWRLEHIAGMLSEDRNWRWLGASPPVLPAVATESAPDAVAAVAEAFTAWRALLTTIPDADLATPIGALGERYGDSTRRALVLHIADELIHHAAEAALLRDLYADVLAPVFVGVEPCADTPVSVASSV